MAGAPALAQPKSGGAPDPRLIEDLVVGNHVLAELGVVDGFGHLSVRHDKDPNRYLMSRSMAPALVKPDDVLEYDLDSVAVDAKGQALFLERFIHGEIYKARPDVKAIVHSHSPSIIPFSVAQTRLQPIYHMSSFLGLDVPVFDVNRAELEAFATAARGGAPYPITLDQMIHGVAVTEAVLASAKSGRYEQVP